MTCVLLLAALTASLPAVAAVVYTETFADAAGWTGPGFDTFSHLSAGGNPDGRLQGSFIAGSFSPPVGRFQAISTSANLNLFGDLKALGTPTIRFDFRPDTILPTAISFRFAGGGITNSFDLNPGLFTVGNWTTVTVPLAFSAGWASQGEIFFDTALASVDMLEVSLLSGGGVPTVAATYSLDNFTLFSVQIPEPHTFAMLVMAMSGIGLFRRYRFGKSTSLLTALPTRRRQRVRVRLHRKHLGVIQAIR
jgi:hypothetical protein